MVKIRIFELVFTASKRIKEKAKFPSSKQIFCILFKPIFRNHPKEHVEKKDAVNDANKNLQIQMTNFVLSDAQAFHVVENPHFRKLIKDLFEIG